MAWTASPSPGPSSSHRLARARARVFRADRPLILEHVCDAAALPRHHTDPFDRLLVAQARAEKLAIISHDANVARYDVRVVDPSR
jgi:PIN domain nuclease of toxin-antitoxin system